MISTGLLRLLSWEKKHIVYQVLWQWGALLTQILCVFFVGHFIQGILLGNAQGSLLGWTGGAFAFAIFFRILCDKMCSRSSYLASAKIKGDLREKIYEKLLRLGDSYRKDVNTAQVVQMCTEGVEQLEVYFARYLGQLFYSILAPLTLFAVLAFVNLKVALILLICTPLIPLSLMVVQGIAGKLLGKYWGIYMNLGDRFLENLQGLTTLKIYQADEKKAEEMMEEAGKFRRITMKVLSMQLNSTTVMDIIAYGGAAIGILVSLNQWMGGELDLAGTIIIILLAAEFFIPLRQLGGLFHIAMNGMAAGKKIFALLDLPDPPAGGETLKETILPVEIRGLDFSYDDRGPVLASIHMNICPGALTALVGPSGCGKSTIAGILMGRNTGFGGSIKVGGKELSSLTEESLMSHITLVSHNSYLFKGTVGSNLAMGKLTATEEEMREVLKKVNLWDFLQGQKGLDTQVKEKGENFSGGQRQRLALARALLHDSPMYIFDEATSNIDVESEELIMRVIHQLAQTKTVLLISHRLACVASARKIYMMEEGKVAAEGSHGELMDQNGNYAKLYRHQEALEAYGKDIRK